MPTLVRDNIGTSVFFTDTLASANRSFSFTSSAIAGYAVSDIVFGLYDTTPGDGGTITVTLYAADVSNGVGAALATLGTINDSALGTATTSTYDFALPASYTLTASTRYFIGLSGTASSAARISFTTDTTGTGITGEYYNRGTSSFANTNGTYIASVTENVACYCRGTAIATGDGERLVQDLAIGDIVVTAAREFRAIKWIGRRSYAARFLAGKPGLWPVRFHAGSLGAGLPRRDLWVSPKHAMLIDGLLVPAECLVNGRSITQEVVRDQVDYFHLELDSHDVVLAEGAPSETFLDEDSRGMFHNAHEFASLYPAATDGGRFCAPRVESGFALEAIRRRLDGHTAPATGLRGYLDHAEPGHCSGWAQDEARPEAPVALEVLVDGVVSAMALADRFRGDLHAAGIGSGRHAFSVAVPACRPGSTVEVRRCSDRAVLGSARVAEAA